MICFAILCGVSFYKNFITIFLFHKDKFIVFFIPHKKCILKLKSSFCIIFPSGMRLISDVIENDTCFKFLLIFLQ